MCCQPSTKIAKCVQIEPCSLLKKYLDFGANRYLFASTSLAVNFHYLLYKAEKRSLRPSVCLSVRSFLVEWISVGGARIGVKLARKEAPVLRGDQVYF